MTTVVICLKNRTFAVSQTTAKRIASTSHLLWFAWKIVLLQYRKQRLTTFGRLSSCCDLLEKSYFCSIANNTLLQTAAFVPVVICLKNRTFAVSQTTTSSTGENIKALWFAWKIVLLQYRKQQTSWRWPHQVGCDLLEKSYFCSIANNRPGTARWVDWVVICLKNRTFAVSQTTTLAEQRARGGCDLLEKSYFCSIANNLNAISICTTNRYKDLRNKKNDTAKRNPTQGEWDFFFLIMPGVRTIPAVAQVR